jgi:hypothetical protein
MENVSVNLKIVILLFIFVIFSSRRVGKMVENFSNSYKTDCDNMMNVLKNVTKERSMIKKDKGWDFYFPCSYNKCEKKIRELRPENKDQKFFLLDGCDSINSKVGLWSALKKAHGRNNASEIMPHTFILYDKKDMADFKNHYKNRKKKNPLCKFVLKNYKQRQEGIKLENNINNIMNAYNDGYFLVQDYYENPFLISKRKINMRYYFLIVCDKDKINGYIHKNGFMYYTPKFYKAGTLDFKEHITTGYIDRKVYEENPLTTEDFNNYLENIQVGSSEMFFKRVCFLFNKVMIALEGKICKLKHMKDNTLFQLFGADIAPDSHLNPKLMEINKGPDLGTKDEKDGKVKNKVTSDIMDIVDIEGDHKIDGKNQFQLIYSKKRN